jgi:hypothetical protein
MKGKDGKMECMEKHGDSKPSASATPQHGGHAH